MDSKEINDVYPASPIEDSNVSSSARFKTPEKYEEIKAKLLESLNPLEADIYILLLEGDGKRIIEIADLIGLDRTETYHVVSALQNKGLVMATFKHPIKFAAVPADKAVRIISQITNKYYAKIR